MIMHTDHVHVRVMHSCDMSCMICKWTITHYHGTDRTQDGTLPN